MTDQAFKTLIRRYWRAHGRHDLPWRKTTDPYRILVSEIMLQQTQVDRVIPKYRMFLKLFPSFRSLARVSTAQVLRVWQGLGYNRRALMLQRCAQAVTKEYKGRLPDDHEKLCALPGIGPYTAGAVLAFAFNKPHPIIETNIRRTYLHYYFSDQEGVSDRELVPIIERTMHRSNPRQWFAALMDYGSDLAKRVPNPNRRSRQYVRQSKFQGSDRQIRGAVIRLVTAKSLQQSVLAADIAVVPDRLEPILTALEKEGFIVKCHHRTCVHNPHWSVVQ